VIVDASKRCAGARRRKPDHHGGVVERLGIAEPRRAPQLEAMRASRELVVSTGQLAHAERRAPIRTRRIAANALLAFELARFTRPFARRDATAATRAMTVEERRISSYLPGE
jgi:hypothetical protein